MILYHGSLERVDKPEIRNANRTLDLETDFIRQHLKNRLYFGLKGS